MSAADEYLKALVTEIGRRRRIWEEMEARARESWQAVVRYAASVGIHNLESPDIAWLADGTGTTVSYRPDPNRPVFQRKLVLQHGGTLPDPRSRIFAEDQPYGYPNLSNDDPDTFMQAAIEQLMIDLNRYVQGREQTL